MQGHSVRHRENAGKQEAIHTCRYMVRVLPMMLVWIVGEGGKAMRLSISEIDVRGAFGQNGEEVLCVIDTIYTGRWW